MPTNDNRTVRFTVMLTKDEWAVLQNRAGLVPAAVWVRARLFGPSPEQNEPSAEAHKISTPAVEVEQRTLPRAASAKRKHLPERKSGKCTYLPIAGTVCSHCGKVHPID